MEIQPRQQKGRLTLPSLPSGWGAEEHGQGARGGQRALEGWHMQYGAFLFCEAQESQVIAFD